MFHEEEGGIQVLTGLAPSSQIVGSLFRILALRTWQKKNQQKVNSMNSLKWKNTNSYFSSHKFGEIKNFTNPPAAIFD